MQTQATKEDDKWVRRMHPSPVSSDSLFDDLKRIYASSAFTATDSGYAKILESPDISALTDNIQLLSQIDSVSTYAPSCFSLRSRSASSSDVSVISELHHVPPQHSFHSYPTVPALASAVLGGILSSIASHREDPRPGVYIGGYGICASLLIMNSNILLRSSGGSLLADLASVGILGLTERSRLTQLESRGYINSVQKERAFTSSLMGSAGSFVGYRLGLLAVGEQVDFKRVICCLGFSFVGSYFGRRMASVLMSSPRRHRNLYLVV